MDASFPISKAGTRSRKPIGSLALMAGIGRPLNPAASWPGKTAGHSWPSTSRECGSPCMPMGRPLFEKAMAPVKAVVPHLAKSTTSRSRPQKPMPPNEHWRPSASRLDLSSIERPSRRRSHRFSPANDGMPRQRVWVFIPMTQRPFRDPLATMAVDQSASCDRAFAKNRHPRAALRGSSAACTRNSRPLPGQDRQKHSHVGRAQTPPRQSTSAVCRLTTLPRLRPSSVRSASPAVCATESARSQSQR